MTNYLTKEDREDLALAALADTCGDFYEPEGEVTRVVERLIAYHLGEHSD